MLHQDGCAGVIDGPEGGDHAFGSFAEEVGADAGNFDAFLFCVAEGGLAGGENDEIEGGEVKGFDIVDREFFTIAEEED